MNQTAIDNFLKTPEFKHFLAEADTWGDARGHEPWANRVAWVVLAMNTKVAKRFARRRALYQESRAWAAYNNLIEFGLISEDPEGVVFEPDHESWGETSDPYAWMTVLVNAAEGNEPPGDFPRIK